MPRCARVVVPDLACHVVQRGNNRCAVFRRPCDYERYLNELDARRRTCRVSVHAYVLMTNHVHLLMTPSDPDGLALLMKGLNQAYVRYYNRAYERTGTLWDGRPHSSLVDSESYALICHRYIEANPVRAQLVARPEDYRWTSFHGNAFGAADPLLTRHGVVEALAPDDASRQVAYRMLFRTPISAAQLQAIRFAARGNFALGSERFLKALERSAGTRVRPTRTQPRRGSVSVPEGGVRCPSPNGGVA